MLTPHALVVLGLVALHVLPTGLNPVRDAASLYATSRFAIIHQVQTFAGGICTLILAGALAQSRAPLPWVGVVALGVNGLAGLMLLTVPAHAGDKDAPMSRRVAIHLVLALVGFGTIALAAGILTAPLLVWPAWHGFAPLLIVAGIWTPVSVILFVVLSGRRRWRPYFGLLQRLIYVGMLCWLAAVLVPLVW